MGGLPCIRGLRVPVATVVGMIGEGMAETEILDADPDLEVEDVREALRYAAEAVREAGASRHWCDENKAGSTSIVQPGCTEPVRCRRRTSRRRWRGN